MPTTERLVVNTNQILFDAQAATGVSTPLNVEAFDNIIVAVTAPLNSTLTFNFQGSIGKSISSTESPTFSSAQAVTNMWDYVAAYDLNDPSSIIVGDTGVALNNASAAANTRFYIINTSLIRWFSMQVSAYTDGSLSAMVATSTI